MRDEIKKKSRKWQKKQKNNNQRIRTKLDIKNKWNIIPMEEIEK